MTDVEGGKVVIAGSRGIDDFALVEEVIEDSRFEISEVVSGRAVGVDTLGEEWGEKNDVPVEYFEIDEYSDDDDPRPNPYIRNEAMAEYADAVILVWDGESGGTDHMRRMAEKHDVPYHLHRTDNTSLSDFC